MIIRNNEHPRGKDMGPVSLMRPVSELSFIGGGQGGRQGTDYRAFGSRIRRPVKVVRVKPEPVLLHVECPVCHTPFETVRTQQVYCSIKCRDRRKRQLDPRRRVKRVRPVMTATCPHPDKKPVARGLCHNCYMVGWRQAKKAA